MINPSRGDDMVTINLGLSFKIGKYGSHLAWHDPMQEIYYRTEHLEQNYNELIVWKKGIGITTQYAMIGIES